MFKKTYLSRAMTRAFAMDHPIGDPFGGPAYGERNDPVSAVVTFFEAATAFETIAAIGTAISVVGMVTGNSGLAKIGGVMGLVGGFGTMAQGGMFGPDMAKWAESTNTAFSSTAQNISSAAVPTDAFANGEVVSQSIAGGASAPTIADTSSLNLEQASGPVESAPVNTPAEGGNGLIDTPMSQATIDGNSASNALNPDGSSKITSSPNPATATPNSTPNPALSTANADAPVNAMQAAAQQGGNLSTVAKAASTGIDTGTSLFDKISAFANKNKALTEIALKGVASMYTSPQDKALKEAQINSSNSMAGLYDAKTAEIQGQAANANAIPNLQNQFSVNTNAQIYNPKPVAAAGVRPAGLIQTRSA